MAVLIVAAANAPCSQVFTQRQQLFICSNNSVTSWGRKSALATPKWPTTWTNSALADWEWLPAKRRRGHDSQCL